eukprot:1199618-Pleurochrysis_carterae.AAC.1
MSAATPHAWVTECRPHIGESRFRGVDAGSGNAILPGEMDIFIGLDCCSHPEMPGLHVHWNRLKACTTAGLNHCASAHLRSAACASFSAVMALMRRVRAQHAAPCAHAL